MTKKIANTEVVLDIKVYPLEAIYGAAYSFLDKAYVFLRLDEKSDSKIRITITPKEEGIKDLKEEFLNELLNYSFRLSIAERNKKIREYIVGAALLGATGEFIDNSCKTEGDWKEDPLGIAIPWEKKYGKR